MTMNTLVMAAALLAGRPAHAAPDLPEIKQAAQVDTMTVGGDLRVREEYFDFRDQKSSTMFSGSARKADRNRERIRLRVRTEYKLHDDLTVVAGLASGVGEQVSTNQTMANHGAQKAIWLDLAYAMWTPGFLGEDGSLKFQAGKMANPLWRIYPSDLVFDSDINPEGFAQSAGYLVGGMVNVFANGMQEAVNEVSGNERDPWVLSEQVGIEVPLVFGMRLMAAGAKHTWLNENSNPFGSFNTQMGNTPWGLGGSPSGRQSATVLFDEYDVSELTGQLSGWIPVPLADISLPFMIQGTFIKNMAARGPSWTGSITGAGAGPMKTWWKPAYTFLGKSDQGYQVGGQIGKAAAPNSFEIAYFYKRVAWDATVADSSDSDFGEGGLNRKGNILWVSYTPNGFVTATVKLFNVRLLDKRYVRDAKGVLQQPDRLNRIQADLSIKF